MYTFQSDHIQFAYDIWVRPERMTYGVSIRNQHVIVHAPLDAPFEHIQSVLHIRAETIDAILKKQSERRPFYFFETDERLPYRGRFYRLIVEEGKETSFRFYQGKFFATIPSKLSKEERRATIYPLYRQWVSEKGRNFVKKQLKQIEPTLPKKEQKYQLQLPWTLFIAPPEVAEYTIAHELAHEQPITSKEQYETLIEQWAPKGQVSMKWIIEHGTLSV